MSKADFPIIGAKVKSVTETFDLTNPDSVSKYFEAKTGKEIEIIKKALEKGNFIAYFVGKKNAGKGTYSKIFSNLIGKDKIVHLSVGDLVREIHADWDNYIKGPKGKKLKEFYRGPLEFDEAVERFLGRSASALLPSEFIIAMLRVKFEELDGKSVFLDGFPREIDQISASLYFKEVIGRGNDKDMYVLIDIPDSVINERIKFRRICPKCQAPRNIRLLPTTLVEYDEKNDEFYLKCDNPSCDKAVMVGKEGDDLGIEPIKERLAKDQQIIDKANELSGIPIIRLRNSVPTDVADENFDNYELTPGFSFEYDKENKAVKVIESPWTVEDNKGVKSYSLMPAPVVVGLLKQMSEVLKEE
ncbi:MAG: nucleoside monophosphate kinase [Microgenomates group bacterium]|jgi:adenylate kinase family enzyme